MKMKKLMIVLAAICAVAITHASTVQWSYTGDIFACDDPDSDGYTYGTAYIVALGTGSIDALAIDTEGNLVMGAGSSLFASSDIIDGGMNTAVKELTTAGAYALVLWDSSFEKWDVIGAYTITPSSADPKVTDTADFAALSSSSEIQLSRNPITAVPEPTSGLLMLVGLAGLALRRRRA
jgi:hypothetical protein